MPANLATLIPADAALDPSKWNLAGAQPDRAALRPELLVQRAGRTSSTSPRPTYAIWFGDNWRVNNQLTVNYGIRWDADPNTASPPERQDELDPDQPRTTRYDASPPGRATTATRPASATGRTSRRAAGFTYNVGGRNDFVIRGGTGLYFASPVSNVTFSPQCLQQPDHGDVPQRRPLELHHATRPTASPPTRSSSAARRRCRRSRRASSSPTSRIPYTWQSSIGFQKQLNSVTGFDADLTHYNEYRDTRTHRREPALQPGDRLQHADRGAEPAEPGLRAGARVHVGRQNAIRRRSRPGLTRRLQKQLPGRRHLHADVVDARQRHARLHDADRRTTRSTTWTASTRRRTDFQRNTVRAYGALPAAVGLRDERLVLLRLRATGSTRASRRRRTARPGTNRLNLTDTGGAAPPIVIPAAMVDRFDGPATIASGVVIPRNALEGLPLHKVDLRVTKDIRHRRHGQGDADRRGVQPVQPRQLRQLQHDAQRDGAGDHRAFGTPVQNTGNAYVPAHRSAGVPAVVLIESLG